MKNITPPRDSGLARTQFAFLRPASFKFLVPLCIVLIPMAVAIVYLIHSNYLPQDDGSDFLISAYRTYHHFRSGGVWDGLHTLYMDRGWRPTIFNLFLLPFLFLTADSIYSAYRATILFIIGYTTLYSFLLLKRNLSSLSASIGAAFVGCLPVWLFLLVYFYSETALPGLLIGIVYHLLKSNNFLKVTHVILAALLAGTAFCIRPEQSAMMLAPIVIVAIGIAWQKNLIAGRDVLLCCFVPLLAVTIFLARVLCAASVGSSFPRSGTTGAAFFLRITNGFVVLVTGTLAILVPIAFTVARKTASAPYSLLCFTLTLCVLPLIWFFPYALELFQWMYHATFGDGAQNMGLRSPPFWTNAWALIHSSGSFVILSAFAVALLGLLGRRHVLRGVAVWGSERRAASYLILGASGPFALTLLGAGLSPSFDASGQAWRRLLAPFCACILACLIIGLRPGRYMAFRQCVALCLLLTQAAVTGMKSAGIDSGMARWGIFTGFLEKPSLLVPEPNHEVIAALNRLADAEAISRVDIEGYTDVSTGAVLTLSNVLPTTYIVTHDYIPTYAGQNDLLDLASRFSYVVFSVTPPMKDVQEQIQKIRVYRQRSDANSHRQADIMELAYSGDLPKYGLQLVQTMVVARSEVLFFRCLAGRASKENIAAASSGARAIATSSRTGFPVSNLNDGTSAPWGSVEGQEDVYAGVILGSPHAIQEVRITLFSPNNLQHLRDISIVAADSEGTQGPEWHIIRSRLAAEPSFGKKITVPLLSDGSVVSVEIDRTDQEWKPYRIWGFACFSGSGKYTRNYLKVGTGIYVRELEMR